MTESQKREIDTLREKGLGYKRIASELGIPEGSIKTYCRRKAEKPEDSQSCCLQCGRHIKNTPHHRARRFCSRECGLKWWHEHPEKIIRKAVYTFTCLNCGRTFTSYGNKGRKYCSHECYIANRFKGGSSAAD